MKIYFLGTNGWYTTPTGNTPCILIDSQEGYVIFDAGNGLYKIDQYIKEDKPISLFISHFHLDHVSGLHTLSKFNFTQPIKIYLAKGRKKDFETLFNAPYTSTDVNIEVHELEEGKNEVGFSVEIFRMHHNHEDHGFRVTLEGKVIAYSGDTGICDNSKLLAQNAEMLIHECSYPQVIDNWGHVDPILAATLAKEANVKKLILTHFDAAKYTSLEKRKWAEDEARKIFPNTQAADDTLISEL
ncbi:MAG: MBL fold metallo-hydrolase [Candidatus Daviesbacteria bacterium]|nr:MBL fold metallo-hydrolase [Candidatus Daviesbacteria bacterium]